MQLVLAGQLADQETCIRRAVNQLPASLQQRVQMPGYLPDSELAYLYAYALFCVAPSHFEGFGMPVAEAMAHGCPCVLSDIPVYREVAGDAAVFVPLGSPEALASGFQELSDERFRHKIATESRAQSARFTWQNTAKSTLDALLTIAAL